YFVFLAKNIITRFFPSRIQHLQCLFFSLFHASCAGANSPTGFKMRNGVLIPIIYNCSIFVASHTFMNCEFVAHVFKVSKRPNVEVFNLGLCPGRVNGCYFHDLLFLNCQNLSKILAIIGNLFLVSGITGGSSFFPYSITYAFALSRPSKSLYTSPVNQFFTGPFVPSIIRQINSRCSSVAGLPMSAPPVLR